MSDGEILRINPKDVANLFAEGKMQVVTSGPAAAPERILTGDRMVERARTVLGKDFLGVEAVKNMEDKLKAIGVDVGFTRDGLPPFPYSEKDIELAKQNGEMIVVRPKQLRHTRVGAALTLINFRELFRKDPLGNLTTPFYALRSNANDWYRSEEFATREGEVSFGWAIVTKDVLPGSTNKTWAQQTEVMNRFAAELQGQGATSTNFRRRTATEAAWDTFLYYVNNGEQLLPNKYDWTQTQASDGGLVYVGDFASLGLRVRYWHPAESHGRLGVVLSR